MPISRCRNGSLQLPARESCLLPGQSCTVQSYNSTSPAKQPGKSHGRALSIPHVHPWDSLGVTGITKGGFSYLGEVKKV